MRKTPKSVPIIPRFSAYRTMWLFVYFDLPTETKKDKVLYRKFREKLLKNGFTMHQYSVYIRHCASTENAEVHIQRVQRSVPSKGKVSILRITDKQYGDIINIWGAQHTSMPFGGGQLEIF
jgi:CRISPR-associated protein Cas2